MKPSRPPCPDCQNQAARHGHPCPACPRSQSRIKPFLSTIPGISLFYLCAILLGMLFSRYLHRLGLPESGPARLLLDIGMGMLYYIVCRWMHDRFHLMRARLRTGDAEHFVD